MILAIFDVPSMSQEQFDKAWDELRQKGATNPDGRLHHFAGTKGMGMVVVDVWESPEKLNTFATTLMPILVGLGVTPPEPSILPIHYSQEG